jgi:8-oxo-dGTP diphosphatase
VSNYPPAFCPYCGHALDPVDPPTSFYCPDCEDHVFHNPTPSARTLVLDPAADAAAEERFLLVQQGTGPVGKWLTPGGKVEIGNTPAEHAGIELREETNLRVDPADLVLFESGTAEVPAGHHIVDFYFAVERGRTSGEVVAGDDAQDARFFTMDGFEAVEKHGFEDQVDHVAELLEAASGALEGNPPAQEG